MLFTKFIPNNDGAIKPVSARLGSTFKMTTFDLTCEPSDSLTPMGSVLAPWPLNKTSSAPHDVTKSPPDCFTSSAIFREKFDKCPAG